MSKKTRTGEIDGGMCVLSGAGRMLDAHATTTPAWFSAVMGRITFGPPFGLRDEGKAAGRLKRGVERRRPVCVGQLISS